MAINLPYNLEEGTIAYARKVMADFRAIVGGLQNVNVDGIAAGDLEEVLTAILAASVQKNETGNSNEIKLDNGQSIQDWVEAGSYVNGVMTSEGMFYFYVDQTTGHLMAVCNGGINASDFEIDNDPNSATYNHLIYTITENAGNTDLQTYDLGNVRGATGATGATGAPGADSIHYYGCLLCQASGWNANNEITLSDTDVYTNVSSELLSDHITNNPLLSHFAVEPSQYLGTYSYDLPTVWNAWWGGKIVTIAQGNGTITLKALGAKPESDILLDIDMWTSAS